MPDICSYAAFREDEMIQRFQRWWYPMMVTTVTNQDEWGYGTVTITPAKRTIPGKIRGWKYRKGTKYPTTVHIGTDDEHGNFVELDKWEIGREKTAP